MAISATYIELQRVVADELGNRTDLLSALDGSSLTLSPVKYAIQGAIAKWEREPFYFNQFYDTSFFTTVNAQEYYTSSDETTIPTNIMITRLHVTISGSRYMMIPRRWQYLEDISTGTTTGKPTDWAYFANQIRLYPIPDGAYAVAASGIKRLTALSADGDANAWTQDGFDLIRSEAKMMLARQVLMDYALAKEIERDIYGDPGNPELEGYLTALRKETALREGARFVRATGTPPKPGS